MPKIDAQIAAGNLDADLAILQTTQDHVRWKRQGVGQPQGAYISTSPGSSRGNSLSSPGW